MSVRIVLVRPRNAENVGAAARALKNFGIEDWAWVDPEFGDLAPARRLAVHAEEMLESARIFQTVHDAIHDCVWVVGTSSRHVRGKRRLAPRAVAEEAVIHTARGVTAIVFGDERSGLTNEEIDRCHDLSAIQTEAEQPSVNLAQAILLYAYELRIATLAVAPPPDPPLPAAATDAEVQFLERSLEELLTQGGFLVHEGRHGMRDLTAPLRRSRLSRAEAALWTSALRAVLKRLP
jgi:TrmH family RNA methyltransferase